MILTQKRGQPGDACDNSTREEIDTETALDRFLAGVEQRAFHIADIATGRSEDAMDLVQDAMLAFVRHYARRPEKEWGPLFHRVLQNRIRDWHRRTAVRARWRAWLKQEDEKDTEEDPIQNVADPTLPDPLRRAADEAAVQALVAALRRLPLRQQQAVLLRVWEGMSVQETAFAMGCAQGSVKTHFSRGVRALREQLEDHWP